MHRNRVAAFCDGSAAAGLASRWAKRESILATSLTYTNDWPGATRELSTSDDLSHVARRRDRRLLVVPFDTLKDAFGSDFGPESRLNRSKSLLGHRKELGWKELVPNVRRPKMLAFLPHT